MSTLQKQMRESALSLCKNLVLEKHAIGAFLFGSVVTGNIHEKSDVDLAIIYDEAATDLGWGKDIRKINDVRVEVWRYSARHFISAFEDEKLRNKPNTWMWASLWVELMQTNEILSDPTGRLAEWRRKARRWKWREKSEINPVWNQAEENLQFSEKCLATRDLFPSLLSLRESVTCLAAAHLMKHNLIPSFRPKDLCAKILLIQTKENILWNLFNLINETATINFTHIEGLLASLHSLIDVEWGKEHRGPRSELENAYGCSRKQDLAGAILSARYAAYWLGFHILKKRDIKLKPRICIAENHVEMVRKMGLVMPAFCRLYQKLHFVKQWNMQRLEDAQNQTRAILPS
jgi:predicted nucleotidyltransferase